jgi:hypothetical protein
MKKELLLASALAGTLGLAGVAEATSMSWSGNHRVKLTSTSADSASVTTNTGATVSSLAVSLSETTDAGMKISSGFTLMTESSGFSNTPSGLTLTFTDGSKLDLISAGNASDSHDVSIPGASGEEGLSYETDNAAPGGIDFGGAGDNVGFEYHSAADAMGVEGMKFGVSGAWNGEAAAVSDTGLVDSAYGIGVTYVTSAGDTSVTVGAGYTAADYVAAELTKDESTTHIGFSATTGNLTIGAGYATGDFITTGDGASSAGNQANGSVTKAGVKYVSGDLTLNVGTMSSEAKDDAFGTAEAGTKDKKSTTGASVDYAVASGVTATLSYTAQNADNDGAKTTSASGSSWYLGANLSF